MKILISIIIFSLFLNSCSVIQKTEIKYSRSKQFNGNSFINMNNIEMQDELDILSWFAELGDSRWPQWINSEFGPSPVDRVGIDEMIVTFINHSTVLIQVDGLNILTDPVWSFVVGPFGRIGLKRHRNPGIRFEDLPQIDYVLISHNHYDHMDIPTLIKLSESYQPKFIVPLGDKELLNNNGIENVIEMDWWDHIILENNQKIFFVPSQHSSQRGLFDRYKSLWGGYVITSTGGPIYFAGDTGFGPHFYKIKELFGKMRFCMLPIGAFKPEKLLEKFHMSPKEAVKVHQILESQLSIGIHWGTFKQTIEAYLDPINYLQEALNEVDLNDSKFMVFKHGKGYFIPKLKTYKNYLYEFNGSTR